MKKNQKRTYLEEIIVQCNIVNIGISRKEFFFIQLLCGCEYKKAENHYNHLIPSNQFLECKLGGNIVVARKKLQHDHKLV